MGPVLITSNSIIFGSQVLFIVPIWIRIFSEGRIRNPHHTRGLDPDPYLINAIGSAIHITTVPDTGQILVPDYLGLKPVLQDLWGRYHPQDFRHLRQTLLSNQPEAFTRLQRVGDTGHKLSWSEAGTPESVGALPSEGFQDIYHSTGQARGVNQI